MKFINYLSSIAGIGIFPLISLLVFFFFFLFLALYVMKADKNRFRYLAALPVEETKADESSNPRV